MSDFLTKEEALTKGWELIQQNPGSKSRILSKLQDEYGVAIEDFNTYDSTVVSNRAVQIHQDRLEKKHELLKDIPGFSQSPEMSDAEIIRIFDSLSELEDQRAEIGRPPLEAEWYIAGMEAKQRIDELEPYYKKLKEEEWDVLEQQNILSPPKGMESEMLMPFLSESLGGVITGIAGLGQEAFFGWMDFFGENPEGDLIAHEKGFGKSWNPFTGFGAWDIAEMRPNPETGGWGFSDTVLAHEAELETLYSIKTHFNEQMDKGGYRDKYNIDQEIKTQMSLLPEGVVDPRTVNMGI